ncbi:MAG: hypothetical protein KatS3mg101_0215 [Patescibacteria group bacterium]|nr:MAG: hypothetical protein KatS3mg101_0215 [Patescibacteria group bacterium]
MPELEKLEEKILAKLLDFLSYSSRTEKEVRDKANYFLRKSDIPKSADREDLVERIISLLKEENLVDDKIYAKRYVEGLILSPKNKSVREAMSFLLKRGVSEDIAESVLEEFGEQLELKSLKSLIEKKSRTYGSLRNPIARQKLIRYLISKGFSYEAARAEVDKTASLK